MRILTIRGRNLASLAGEFEVALDAGPLAQAGVFAITGQTGAGKSTLLDAMCLALFDKTPRLHDTGGVFVGREEEVEQDKVRSNDVKNLLRRGTGEGYAEVVFRGIDGRTYCARWTVRRARKKASGKLQKQEMTLQDVETGELTGGTKGEVLDAIAEKIGLTFDQFRRSVLLAQGDFAAFLEAKESERASLLERITGTDIYTRISKKAHERASQERRALEDLQRQQANVSLLDDEARAQLEGEIGELKTAEGALGTQRDAAKDAAAWYAQLTALEAGEKAAHDEAQARATEWSEAEALREQVAAVEAVQPLRGTVAALDQIGAKVAAARIHAAESRQRAETLAAAETACLEERGDAEQAEEAALAAHKEAQPALDRARALDARIESAREKLADATRAAEDAHTAARTERQNAASLETEVTTWRERLEEAAAWLTANAHLRSLAEEWGRWQEKLASYQTHASDLVTLEGGRDQRLTASEDAGEKVRTLESRLTEARTELSTRRARAEALDQEAERARPAGYRDERQRLETRRDGLRELEELLARAVEATAAEAAAKTDAAAAEARATAARAARQEAEQACARLEPALAEARRAHADVIAAQGADQLRAHLRPGEPCPVCGASDHPWADHPPAFSDLVDRRAQRVSELQSELDARRRDAATAEATAGNEAARVEEAEARGADRAEKLAAIRARWAAACAALHGDGIPADPLADHATAIVQAEAQSTVGALAQIETQLAQAEAAEAAADDARRAADELQVKIDELQVELEEARKSQKEADQVFETGERQTRRARETMARLADELAPPFSGREGWRERLERDAAGFTAECADQVQLWKERTDQHRESRTRLTSLEPALQAARQRTQEADRAVDKSTSARTAAEERARALADERSGVLDGRPVAEVESALQQAIEAARTRCATARQAAGDATRAAAAGLADANKTAEIVVGLQAEQDTARLALDQALVQAGCDEETLRARLVHDTTWLKAQRQLIDARRQAHARAEAIAKERTAQREKHRGTGQPEMSAAEAAELTESVATELQKLSETLLEKQTRLNVDTQNRARLAALTTQIEETTERARVWLELDELIGSADGKKLRVFAQSLTFEALVAQANHRLRELTPRYSLMRVPRADLALQVIDHDMGDEVRSSKSLSGGETFLASLALALGLASLSTNQTQVESLFVDEGFGSLDPSHLDTVIAALDTLQASGRQIGVISHVGAVAERVGARVVVEARGAGRSKVTVLA